jgi:hypothetical protein
MREARGRSKSGLTRAETRVCDGMAHGGPFRGPFPAHGERPMGKSWAGKAHGQRRTGLGTDACVEVAGAGHCLEVQTGVKAKIR